MRIILYVSTVSLALAVLVGNEAGLFNTVVTLTVVAFLAWRIIYQRYDKHSVMHELSRELDGLEVGWMDENRQARVCRLSECEHVVDVGYKKPVWVWFMRSSSTERLYRIEFIRDRGRYCYSGVSGVTCDDMKEEVLRHDVDTYRAHFGEPLVG